MYWEDMGDIKIFMWTQTNVIQNYTEIQIGN